MVQARRRFLRLFQADRFPLLWYFVLTSLIAIGATTVVLALILHNRATTRFIERSQEQGITEAGHILQLLYTKVVAELDFEGTNEKLAEAMKLQLGPVVNTAIFGLDVHKLVVFDLSGQVVFSTAPKPRTYRGRDWKISRK